MMGSGSWLTFKVLHHWSTWELPLTRAALPWINSLAMLSIQGWMMGRTLKDHMQWSDGTAPQEAPLQWGHTSYMHYACCIAFIGAFCVGLRGKPLISRATKVLDFVQLYLTVGHKQKYVDTSSANAEWTSKWTQLFWRGEEDMQGSLSTCKLYGMLKLKWNSSRLNMWQCLHCW